jgi:phosphoribosyl 1,2-cyclic phosphodiesterase
MVNISAIASGSNGNCYFLGNGNDSVLVDAGISCKQILLRMEGLGLDVGKIRGVFVSHEHIDHINGITVLAKKFEIPVYITEKTLANSGLCLRDDLIMPLIIGKQIKIGGIKVNSFTKSHDAVEPCSYILSCENKNVGVMTDIGLKCSNVADNIAKCDAVFLESNYDEHMLEHGGYPIFLKRRVASDTGHLSNYQAGLLVLEHAKKRLKNVFLSHLSGNNNTPGLALKTFEALVKQRKDLDINVRVTSREKESELVNLD